MVEQQQQQSNNGPSDQFEAALKLAAKGRKFTGAATAVAAAAILAAVDGGELKTRETKVKASVRVTRTLVGQDSLPKSDRPSDHPGGILPAVVAYMMPIGAARISGKVDTITKKAAAADTAAGKVQHLARSGLLLAGVMVRAAGRYDEGSQTWYVPGGLLFPRKAGRTVPVTVTGAPSFDADFVPLDGETYVGMDAAGATRRMEATLETVRAALGAPKGRKSAPSPSAAVMAAALPPAKLADRESVLYDAETGYAARAALLQEETAVLAHIALLTRALADARRERAEADKGDKSRKADKGA